MKSIIKHQALPLRVLQDHHSAAHAIYPNTFHAPRYKLSVLSAIIASARSVAQLRDVLIVSLRFYVPLPCHPPHNQ
jgi:hypothetical protein